MNKEQQDRGMSLYKKMVDINAMYPAKNDIQLMQPVLKVIPGMFRKNDIDVDGYELHAVLKVGEKRYQRSIRLTVLEAGVAIENGDAIRSFIDTFKTDML